jgi:hypothetical protein
MFYKRQAVFLAAMLPLTSAYRVVFYTGFDCNGESLGSRNVALGDSCQDPEQFGFQASSVLIVVEEGDEQGSIVGFYPDATCKPEEAISAANTGCINVYQDGGFGGYRVISGEMKRREVEEEASSNAARAESESPLGITHGDFFEMDGELWRWNQIAQDTFSGVKPEDWEDAGVARIANFAPLEYGDDYPFNFTEYDLNNPTQDVNEDTLKSDLGDNFSPNPGTEVAKRLERRDICGRVRNCVWSFGILAEYYFPRQTQAVVNQIAAAKPAAQSIWSFLQNPYVSGFTVGLTTGAIGARYFGSAPDCVTGAEADSVRQTINEGVTTTGVNAISTDVFDGINGDGTLTTIIVPPSERGTGICNTPATDPGSSRLTLSRHERSLYANVPGFEKWLKTKNFAI